MTACTTVSKLPCSMLQFANNQLLMFLRAFAGGNIDHRGKDRRSTISTYRIKSDFDRKCAAIFALATQIAPKTHQSHFGFFLI